MSSGHREAIVRPSCTIRNNIVCKTASSSIFASPSGIIVSYSCVHRVSIVWPSVGFVYASGSILAFYQIRDEKRAKLKISYSCCHRVSKSARYDATLSKQNSPRWDAALILVHVRGGFKKSEEKCCHCQFSWEIHDLYACCT